MRKSLFALTLLLGTLYFATPVTAQKYYATYFYYPDVIEESKKQMLSTCDSLNEWGYENQELQQADSHAYWLMQRMMDMMRMIETAEDALAWSRAMDESINEYNRRIGRNFNGGRDLALESIRLLIDRLDAANSYEYAIITYVESMIEHLNAIGQYCRLIDTAVREGNEDLTVLVFNEYKAWFNLNNVANALMLYYEYAAAPPTIVDASVNYCFGEWSKSRAEEVALEIELIQDYCDRKLSGEPINHCKSVSQRRFTALIESFYQMDRETIVERYTDIFDGDKQSAEERAEFFDIQYEKIDTLANLYYNTYDKWVDFRLRIAQIISPERAKQYHRLTQKVHRRLYDELKDISTPVL